MCRSLYVLEPRHKGRLGHPWHEGEGALTVNEFASSVTVFFADNPGFSRNILYSDGSTNQSRYSTLSKALLHFAVTHNVEVEQKYLEKGHTHTHMKVHSVHGCVERHFQERFNLRSYLVPGQNQVGTHQTISFPSQVLASRFL